MPNVSIDVNVEAKTLSVSVDGVSIPNIKEVRVYQYNDSDGEPYGIDVSMDARIEDNNGVIKQTSYYVYGSERANEIMASCATKYEDIPGFVGVDGVVADVTEFMGNRKRGF